MNLHGLTIQKLALATAVLTATVSSASADTSSQYALCKAELKGLYGEETRVQLQGTKSYRGVETLKLKVKNFRGVSLQLLCSGDAESDDRVVLKNKNGEELNASSFTSYDAHYISFELDYPHIYDLMFGNIDIDMHLYPDLHEQLNASFDGLVEGLRPFMPDASEQDIKIKAVNIWASVHGLVGILRQGVWQANKIESLEWIENNLEEYLQLTTFR